MLRRVLSIKRFYLLKSRQLTTFHFRQTHAHSKPPGIPLLITVFFGGLKARIQRLFIRKSRPWTIDDILALGSWLFVGNGLFLLIGTTSFASVLLIFTKSLQIQEVVAEKLAHYLTNSTGVRVNLTSKIIPNWKDGKISLNDVSISKHLSEENQNCTMFDLKISKLDVEISLMQFLEGKGWIKSCFVKGIRGTIDRSYLIPSTEKYKHAPQSGEFHFEEFIVKDALFTVLHRDFRPYGVSILSAEFGLLRKRWLLLDLLSAKSIVGVYDGCLFSVHTPQIDFQPNEEYDLPNMRHFKIDGLNVDHVNANTVGPLSWISKGKIDFDILLQLPTEEKKFPIDFNNIKESVIMSIIRQMDKASFNVKKEDYKPYNEKFEIFKEKIIVPLIQKVRIKDLHEQSLPMGSAILEKDQKIVARNFASAPEDSLAFKVDLRLRDITASVPIKTENLSFISNTLVRPLVGYINEHKPGIPISTFFVQNLVNNFSDISGRF